MGYTPPAVSEIGTLRDLTLAKVNKVGFSRDMFSPGTPLIGSIVPPR